MLGELAIKGYVTEGLVRKKGKTLKRERSQRQPISYVLELELPLSKDKQEHQRIIRW